MNELGPSEVSGVQTTLTNLNNSFPLRRSKAMARMPAWWQAMTGIYTDGKKMAYLPLVGLEEKKQEYFF